MSAERNNGGHIRICHSSVMLNMQHQHHPEAIRNTESQASTPDPLAQVSLGESHTHWNLESTAPGNSPKYLFVSTWDIYKSVPQIA